MRYTLILMLLFCNFKCWSQETGENKFGAWWMYFGTAKLAEKYSIHSELQVRMYEPLSNFNQLLPRIGLNYHITENTWATLGYAWIPTESFEKDALLVSSKEHRIWQQLMLRNKVGKFAFEHRYRLEQRWISTETTDSYRDRFRYRLMITAPIGKPELVDNTFFAAFYDELFMNIDNAPFDQNRLYFALGYKLNNALNFQSGYMRHRLGNLSFDRLQFAVFWNPDFSHGN